MVSTRRKSRADGGSAGENANTDIDVNSVNASGGGSGYEELREQRIKENKERMHKLGIFDLSLSLKSRRGSTRKPSRNASTLKQPPKCLPLSTSPRRSSRLKSMTPVNYTNYFTKTKKEYSKVLEIRIQEGSKPEIYDKGHEKLLGDCKTTWTLSVDGHGKDGKRIYDPEKGETCHQCRQKTLGHHTHCSCCEIVQGQFCGDCLYMRYGENAIEVNENPNWICPVCRGICNCSLCRKAKGWAPTGPIYRKVADLGFKSVAHYLIQTRQIQTHSEDSGFEIMDSEERELPSSDKGLQLEHQSRFPDPQAGKNEAKMEEEGKQVYHSDATS